MSRFIVAAIALIFMLNMQSSYAQIAQVISPSVITNAYNPHNFVLYLNNKQQGFFNSYDTALQAVNNELRRKSSRTVQLLDNNARVLLRRQHPLHRTNFLPWEIEVSPHSKAVYFNASWEGDAEICLITPSGKRISQKDFGSNYPNILSYYGHEGIDVLILDPSPGIWQVWVLGKFQDAKIALPTLSNIYLSDYTLQKTYHSLSFAAYWGHKFYEDFSPVKFFLADNTGKLYLMQAYNNNILREYRGYNGLAMDIREPVNGVWKLIALTTNPDIKEIKFKVSDSIKTAQGTLTKVAYDKNTDQYLFYWKIHGSPAAQKLLFLSVLPSEHGNLNNIIVPLTENPQAIPASMLPAAFSYKYFISSPYEMGDYGLLKGPIILNQNFK